MAKLYLGFNVGADYTPDKVQSGSSTTGADVELVVDLTKFDNKTKTKLDLSLIMEALEGVIEDERDFGLPA